MQKAALEPRVTKPSPLIAICWHALPSLFALLLAAPGAAAAESRACRPISDTAGSLWAAADFDGDKSVELARLAPGLGQGGSAASRVDLFAFCPGSVPAILTTSPQSELILSARDVDDDADSDLVLHDPLAGGSERIWLNDGNGVFTEAEDADIAAGGGASRFERNLKRFREPAFLVSFNPHASVAPRAGFAIFAPGARRRDAADRSRAASNLRQVRQSRAPPFLSN